MVTATPPHGRERLGFAVAPGKASGRLQSTGRGVSGPKDAVQRQCYRNGALERLEMIWLEPGVGGGHPRGTPAVRGGVSRENMA